MTIGRKSAVLWAALCAAAWLLIALYIPGNGPAGADTSFAVWAAALRNDGWTAVWKAIALLGESTSIIVVTLVLTALAAWRTGLVRSLWILGGVAAAYVLNTLLKFVIDRPRPDYAWGIEADGASFPSGSAMLAVVLYGLTAFWLSRYGRIGAGARTAVRFAALLLILLMGWSRLYFGVHYATDIVAGYAAGGVVLLLALALAPAPTNG